jgi:hypothetical protein
MGMVMRMGMLGVVWAAVEAGGGKAWKSTAVGS